MTVAIQKPELGDPSVPVLTRILANCDQKKGLAELAAWKGMIFSEIDIEEIRGKQGSQVVPDAGMFGFNYVRKIGKPCLIITKSGWFTILRNDADCMALIRLRSAIRSDEWVAKQKCKHLIEVEHGKRQE